MCWPNYFSRTHWPKISIFSGPVANFRIPAGLKSFFFIFQDFVGPKETLHPEQIWVTGMRERNGWIEAMLNNLIHLCGRNTIISSTAATTTTQTHKRQKKKTLSQCCITMYIINNWQVLIHKYSQNTSQQVTFTYSQSSFFFGWKFLISFLKT